ncbi:prepilin peptidase, partial [Paracraurococcus ruber]|nr:hypothetical protein [Paracraurococcus ruber]
MLIAGDLPLLLPGAAGTGALLGAAGHALARACGAGAGGLLPLAACGALGALPAALLLPPAAWLGAGALGTLLLAIARLDLVTGEVHAGLAGPLALLGLAQGFATGALALAAAGAAFGYLLCRLAEAGFRAATARDGLGRGDAWVLGAAGAWTGPGGTGPT